MYGFFVFVSLKKRIPLISFHFLRENGKNKNADNTEEIQLKKLSVIGSITMLVLTIGVSFGIKQVKADSLRSSQQYLNLSTSAAKASTDQGRYYQIITTRGIKKESFGYQHNYNNELWYEVILSDGNYGWISSSELPSQLPVTITAVATSKILNAPLISQNPELRRGCEVTSLAMMLQYAGVNVDKMTLAAQVRKDTTPYKYINGTVYFGNPNTGFVGNMYSFNYPGYGVYHGPIKALADKYLPGRVVDLSGNSFETIYQYLNNGKPVWVVNNVMFDTVPSQFWQKWQTPTGPISITMKDHSVLVTGYDQNYIYFNDPLANIKNRKVSITRFKRGWEQMGRQAISYR
jgi:uncharacterized protein YvpB